MDDHQYPMRDALASALDRIDPTDEQLREEYEEIDEDTRANDLEATVLDISHFHTFDILLTCGGPTCYFRVVTDDDYDINHVEYHDSWASPVQQVRLSEDEEERLDYLIRPHLDTYRFHQHAAR